MHFTFGASAIRRLTRSGAHIPPIAVIFLSPDLVPPPDYQHRVICRSRAAEDGSMMAVTAACYGYHTYANVTYQALHLAEHVRHQYRFCL